MDITAKLDEALSFIANAREELKNGNVIVMEGFQDEVSSLCAEMGKLPVTEMQNYSEKLNTLGSEMQLLEDEMKEQQNSVQQEIMELGRKQKALKSYETASHSDKKDGE